MPFLLTIWHQLDRWDKYLFTKINGDWSSPALDTFMQFMRHSVYWAPLYLFLFVFAVLNFRIRGFWWCIFFLSTIALTDMTGTYIFKHHIERLRPCSDPAFYTQVRMVLNQCAGGYGFISNHAANHFGMAVFFLFTFRKMAGRWVWLGIAWAALIAYAQVYVGVHYPGDVLAGACWGSVIGWATAFTFNKRFGFAIFEPQLTA